MSPAKKKKAEAPAAEVRAGNPIIAYKGFNKDWKCMDYQYKVGESYEHKGNVAACQQGFHACEMPLDVLTYYRPNTSVFAIVEADGKIDRKGEGDSKLAAGKLTIKAEIKLLDLIKIGVTWIRDHAKNNTASAVKECAAAMGNYGHAAATGNYGHAAATGYYGHAAAMGDSGHAAATGYSGHAAATGNYGHAAATGYYGCAFVGFGGKAKAGATGAFAIAWFDESAKRARLAVGIPGENGIKPDIFYQVKNGQLAEVVA